MRRFILILSVALLLATMLVPAAFARTSAAPAGLLPSRSQTLICTMRMCPDGTFASCYCSRPWLPLLTQ